MESLPVQSQTANIVNIEDFAMSVDGLVKQVQLIQRVMNEVMVEDEHYGKIPGTKKPTLLKPGAEKLCLTFRLDPDYQIIREVRDRDFIAYTVKCILTHIPTRTEIASGIGSCNSRETKYRWRNIEESTGKPVPKEYWNAKNAGESKEMKRILGGDDYRAAKIDGQWVIALSQKVENDNPWDLDNTLIKMACKRALVAATLNATAASDLFTQDLEELPPGIAGTDGNGKSQKQEPTTTTKATPKDKALQLLKENIAKAGLTEADFLKVAGKESLGAFTVKALDTMNSNWATWAAKALNKLRDMKEGAPATDEKETPQSTKPLLVLCPAGGLNEGDEMDIVAFCMVKCGQYQKCETAQERAMQEGLADPEA